MICICGALVQVACVVIMTDYHHISIEYMCTVLSWYHCSLIFPCSTLHTCMVICCNTLCARVSGYDFCLHWSRIYCVSCVTRGKHCCQYFTVICHYICNCPLSFSIANLIIMCNSDGTRWEPLLALTNHPEENTPGASSVYLVKMFYRKHECGRRWLSFPGCHLASQT